MKANRISQRPGLWLGISGLLFCLLAPPAKAAELREILSRAQWPEVRTGMTVLGIEPLKRSILFFDANPGSRLIIRYPGGDVGNAWAFELRDWLISLGLASKHIRLEPGSGVPNAIMILVTDQGVDR
ncbi:MAG: hypothetical protein CL393_05930 [Acidiferrobacteraceae bacterium]|nr:hypothetical protein [Acidiferrobacteraceae bacterium]